jgi:hypothetical protein
MHVKLLVAPVCTQEQTVPLGHLPQSFRRITGSQKVGDERLLFEAHGQALKQVLGQHRYSQAVAGLTRHHRLRTQQPLAAKLNRVDIAFAHRPQTVIPYQQAVEANLIIARAFDVGSKIRHQALRRDRAAQAKEAAAQHEPEAIVGIGGPHRALRGDEVVTWIAQILLPWITQPDGIDVRVNEIDARFTQHPENPHPLDLQISEIAALDFPQHARDAAPRKHAMQVAVERDHQLVGDPFEGRRNQPVHGQVCVAGVGERNDQLAARHVHTRRTQQLFAGSSHSSPQPSVIGAVP